MHDRIQPADVFEPVPGLYTQLIACAEGDRYEIAGTLPYHLDGSLDEDLATQSAVVMDNLGRTLATAGLERSDIVRINTFVADRAFLKPYMEVRDRLFVDPAPASTLIIVSGFSRPEFKIEIEAIAAG